ncbi:hypothetical protein Leryth_000079 [Lithospermum erythrorhizon]|nr:hypothetical protein Leryth_000079 [Lithospermum erythrorhizon]
MQQKFLQPSWAINDFKLSAMDSIFDDYHHPDVSSSFTLTEDSSETSVESLLTSMLSDQEIMEEGISSSAVEEVCKWLISDDHKQDMQNHQSPCSILENEFRENNSEVVFAFPDDILNTDDKGNVHRLIKAYGEASENGLSELKDVISQRILEKINPLGEAAERVAFHLLRESEETGSYLKQESSKNIESAFNVFYQSLPYGRFAHYIANQSILESIPGDTERVTIIDFDIRDGTQWPYVLENIASRKILELRIISIKLEENEICPSSWKLEETKRRLHQLANTCGLVLKFEEIRLDALMTELKRMKKTSSVREWTAFNCMFGLPHMHRRRSRIQAMEFMFTAKVFLSDYMNRRGIITFGDGETGESMMPCSSYASFFSNHFRHYQAFFESMEIHFPVYLRDARIAMECLYLSPYVSANSWIQLWKEKSQISDLREEIGLKGCKMSKESIMEAKVMVNEANSLYTVTVEGQELNEMVLEWRGTPLIRVSTWI